MVQLKPSELPAQKLLNLLLSKDKKVSEIVLEERKIKALEKIAASLDSLAFWFEGVDKDGWDDRMQYYLGEWHKSLDNKSDK